MSHPEMTASARSFSRFAKWLQQRAHIKATADRAHASSAADLSFDLSMNQMVPTALSRVFQKKWKRMETAHHRA